MKTSKTPFILPLTFIMAAMVSFSQDLTCEDFREGIFIADTREVKGLKWKVIRKGNQQIEQAIEIPETLEKENYTKEVLYEIIEWIDDCTYSLKYDDSKFELNAYQKFINDNGGVINQITKIEGNCFYYVSTLKVNGQEQIIEGKLCKEDDKRNNY